MPQESPHCVQLPSDFVRHRTKFSHCVPTGEDKIPSNSREIVLEPHTAMLDNSQEENFVFAPLPSSRITKPVQKLCKTFTGETDFVCLPT